MTDFRDNELVNVGIRIREIRKTRDLTLDTLASRTGLSKGLLSKIENFRTIPSLPVLATIAKHLQVDMAELVAGIGINDSEKSFSLVKKADRKQVGRDDAEGFLHELLVTRTGRNCVFESVLLTLSPGSRRSQITTDADQFIYLLSGKIDFHLGKEVFAMEAGDAAFFDGRIPHVPVNRGKNNAELLAVYLLDNNGSTGA